VVVVEWLECIEARAKRISINLGGPAFDQDMTSRGNLLKDLIQVDRRVACQEDRVSEGERL
jgi:hypothetical protein